MLGKSTAPGSLPSPPNHTCTVPRTSTLFQSLTCINIASTSFWLWLSGQQALRKYANILKKKKIQEDMLIRSSYQLDHRRGTCWQRSERGLWWVLWCLQIGQLQGRAWGKCWVPLLPALKEEIDTTKQSAKEESSHASHTLLQHFPGSFSECSSPYGWAKTHTYRNTKTPLYHTDIQYITIETSKIMFP